MSAPEQYHIMSSIAQSDPDMDPAIAVLNGTCHFENKSHSNTQCGLSLLPIGASPFGECLTHKYD